MKTFLTLLIGVVLGAGALWFASGHFKGEEKKEEKAEHHEEGAAEEGVIKLEKKKQEVAGIQTAAPKAVKLAEQVKGYGRVLDPAPIVAMMLDAQAAQAAAEASEKDLKRLQSLFQQGQNASAKALETAEAAARRDQSQMAAAQSKLRLTLGAALRPDVIDKIGALQWSLARVDVPSGEAIESKAAAVMTLANEKAPIDSEILGPAPSAEDAIQGQGYLLLMKTNSLAPNTAISAALDLSGHEEEGFVLPKDAVLQEGAENIAFIQTGDETFRKIEIEIERAVDGGWFVTMGLAATNRVVVAGAHQLLSITHAEPAE